MTSQPEKAGVPQPEKARTCTLPSQKDTSFLRFTLSEWSKIDIIGQTILLSELTGHFGSFQNTCTALKIRSNEIESFLLTHLQYKQAHEQGRLIAAQWGQDQAIPGNDGHDIPQQRPVLVCASSIMPACDFLKDMGYEFFIPAVRAWIRRTITWPPDIDVTDLDTSTLDQSDVTFPAPRQQREYSRYTGSLGDDTRAVVAFVGSWRPRDDGTPDARLSFIDVPNGSVVYGPHGVRRLMAAGRYYVCWPSDSLSDSHYVDFVLAQNVFNDQEDSRIGSFSSSLGTKRDGLLEVMSQDESPSKVYSALHTDSSINPKGIFGPGMPDTHGPVNIRSGPFHSQGEPQGPLRALANPQLQQAWSSWPGQLFQFRLDCGYTILDPMGNLLTFDPPHHERYDNVGNPHGNGGTYFIVPPLETSEPISFKPDELPADVALRFKVSEKLVLIRDGMVLPRFIKPGVHEWSTREGYLDLYSADGCYDVLRAVGRYSVNPVGVENAIEPGAHQVPEHHHEHNNGLAYRRDTMGLPPTEEASQILASYRNRHKFQQAEAKRFGQDSQYSTGYEVRHPGDATYQGTFMQERNPQTKGSAVKGIQDRASVGTIIPGNSAMAQQGRYRGERMKSSNEQFDVKKIGLPSLGARLGDAWQGTQFSTDNNPDSDGDVLTTKTPKSSRRKRPDSDDDEYTPTKSKSHASRAKKQKSTPKTPTPRKSQQKAAQEAHDADESPSPSVLKSRRTSSRLSLIETQKRASSSAPTSSPAHTSPTTPKGPDPSRAVPARKPLPGRKPLPDRKPTGALPETTWGDRTAGEDGKGTLELPNVPK